MNWSQIIATGLLTATVACGGTDLSTGSQKKSSGNAIDARVLAKPWPDDPDDERYSLNVTTETQGLGPSAMEFAYGEEITTSSFISNETGSVVRCLDAHLDYHAWFRIFREKIEVGYAGQNPAHAIQSLFSVDRGVTLLAIASLAESKTLDGAPLDLYPGGYSIATDLDFECTVPVTTKVVSFKIVP